MKNISYIGKNEKLMYLKSSIPSFYYLNCFILEQFEASLKNMFVLDFTAAKKNYVEGRFWFFSLLQCLKKKVCFKFVVVKKVMREVFYLLPNKKVTNNNM